MTIALSFLKKSFSWDHLDIYSLLHYYRYISLIVTSVFYFFGPPAALFYLKLGVVVFLFLEAWIFIKVFNEIKSELMKKVLIVIELTGFLVILLLTGGLDSAFLWYAINPVLLSTTLVPYYFCWISATAFTGSAFYLQRFVAGHPEFSPVVLAERAYIILIFILITLSAQLSNHLINKLSIQKEVMERQLEHIKSLYEAAEVFTRHSDPQEVANLFASYSKALTGATKSIIWARELGANSKLSNVIYAVKGPKKVLLEQSWYPYVKKLFEDEKNNGWKTDFNKLPSGNGVDLGTLVTVRIKSSTNLFGVLSVYYSETVMIKQDETEKTLIFLADLCAASLEKRYLELMADKLLLAEEKDRIARQIHDTVNQNIFGLIHGLNNVKKQYHFSQDIADQLALLQKTAHRCLQELRQSIYNLSENHCKDTFDSELRSFLNDLQSLNDVRVELKCGGDLDKLDMHSRSSLSRIIREASSNAIRHGSCENITIDLQVKGENVSLIIADDGSGFSNDDLFRGKNKGLGLLSMKELARGIGSELSIKSSPGQGTAVVCRSYFSVQRQQLYREEVLGR